MLLVFSDLCLVLSHYRLVNPHPQMAPTATIVYTAPSLICPTPWGLSSSRLLSQLPVLLLLLLLLLLPLLFVALALLS